MIKTIGKLTLLIGAVSIIAGCAAKDPNYKTSAEKRLEAKKLTLDLNKPISETKVYVDNTLDIERSKEIMDVIYKSLKNGSINELEIDKDVGRLNNNATRDHYFHTRINHTKTRIEGPFVISSTCLAFCDTLPIDSEKVTRTENTITLENFNTIKHIILGYKGLSKRFYELDSELPYSIRTQYGIQTPLKLDKSWLTTDKMILSDEYLKAYSIKIQLVSQLKTWGFQIADKKDQADIVMNIENLGFGRIQGIKHWVKAPKTNFANYSKDGKGMGDLAQITHLAGGGSSTGGAKLGLAFGALGIAADIFGNAKDFLYTFNAVSVYQDNKLIKKLYINTEMKDKGWVEFSDGIINGINHAAVQNFMGEHLTVNVSKKLPNK